MVRKLSLAISLALGAASYEALALGLGDIKARSALNESFDADIQLLAVKKGAIDSVKVQLAEPEVYENAGVERSFLLSKLKFEPIRLPNGSAIIRVTSRVPIREPFLNFLIELNWPEGRMIREYTVLLDPPESMQQSVSTVQPTGISGPILGMSEPVITPMREGGVANPGGMAPPPGGYGPVASRETLWSIAKRFQYPQAEMDQMVIAILRANPEAFLDGHVNNLEKGSMLAIPSVDAVLAIDPAVARKTYRSQLANWQGAGPTATGQVARGSAGKAQPAAPAAAPGSGAELKIAGGGDGASKGQIQRLEQDLLAAQEAAESVRRENEELRARLDDLEAQINDMQQLLALKDEQLAQLEEQSSSAAAAASAAPPVASQPAPQPKPEPVAGEGVTASKPETPPVVAAKPPAKPEPPVEPPVTAAKPAEPVAPVTPVEAKPEPAKAAVAQTPPPPKPAPATPPVAQAPAKPKPATPPKPKPAPAPPAPAPEEEESGPGILDMVMENAIYIGGGVLVLLLGGAGAFFIRRRKMGSGGTSEPESILMSDASHGESEIATEESPLSGLTTEETSFLDSLSSTGNFSEENALDDGDETSFLSDFVPSDIEALQEETGEVDPLAEADVYIAYGRFKQAEELVRQAMEKDPSKSDYRFKLFEVLHAAKDVHGFSQLVAESSNLGLESSEPDGWKRVLEMDKELSSGEGGAAADAGGDLDDLDLGGLDDPGDLSAGGDDDDMDLDFSELGLDGDTEPQFDEKEGTPIEDEGDEFDGLDLTGLVGEEAASAASAEDEGEADAEEDDLDFDLDFSEETTVSSGAKGGGGDDDEFSLDLDLGGGDSGIPDLGGQIDGLPGEEEGLEITGMNKPESEEDDILDFSFDSDADEAPPAAPASGGSADGVDPEEVATKLDLARAYIDMGDEDGAKDILNEVASEGTSEQKAEANSLLGQIG